MNKFVETKCIEKVRRTTDYLGRSHIFELFRMLPTCALFAIEMHQYDGDEDVLKDTLTFQRTEDDDAGCRKALFELLGRYPEYYSRVLVDFEFGFGFDCKIRVYIL